MNTKSFWEHRVYRDRADSAEYEEEEAHRPTRYFLRKLLPAIRGCDVLELGCGPGELTPRLAAVARSVVGVDFSSTAIEAARRRCSTYTNVSFVEEDALEFRPGRRFDVITGRMVLHEVMHGETPRMLERFDELLGEHGFLYFHENSYFNGLARFVRSRLVGRFGVPKHGSLHELPFDEDRFRMYREHFRYCDRSVLWVEAGAKIYEYMIPWKHRRIEQEFLLLDKCLSAVQADTGRLDNWSYSQSIYASHDRPLREALADAGTS